MIVHAGDKVWVREWDDMVAEFGIDGRGDIPCRMEFIKEMRKYCGQEYTVYEVWGRAGDSFLVTFEEDDGTKRYTWSSDMIQISCPWEDKIAISSLEGLV